MKVLIFNGLSMAAALTFGVVLTACSDEQPPTDAIPPQAATLVDSAAAVPGSSEVRAASQDAYSPEALETLLAPVALYPDPVLAQVLATSTNPQEVLDAGNWLLQNEDLTGPALEDAATAAGFTPSMIAMVQFPTVVDMMCMEMDWTTDLGAAFLADESGVLGAVQRLRKQAADMGNLQSSEQMQVTTETQNNQEVIVVQPAQPEVVYVPQYNPTAVYTTPAPTITPETGYSSGELITTGLLAFGAGILVNEVFSDDDDDYYNPRWGYGYGGPPYYPPPYRPRYGNGYRPAHDYNRPRNYQHGFNNNNIYVNTNGKDYFKQFDGGRNNYRKKPQSPISAARPNRPELASLNQRPRTATRQEIPRSDGRDSKGSYAGAQPGAREKITAQRPTTAAKAPTGTYAGANRINKPQTSGTRDRGRVDARPHPGGGQAAARPKNAPKPSARPVATQRKMPKPAGFQGSHGSGKSERAASKRGRASMPKGTRPSARSQSGPARGKRR